MQFYCLHFQSITKPSKNICTFFLILFCSIKISCTFVKQNNET